MGRFAFYMVREVLKKYIIKAFIFFFFHPILQHNCRGSVSKNPIFYFFIMYFFKISLTMYKANLPIYIIIHNFHISFFCQWLHNFIMISLNYYYFFTLLFEIFN